MGNFASYLIFVTFCVLLSGCVAPSREVFIKGGIPMSGSQKTFNLTNNDYNITYTNLHVEFNTPVEIVSVEPFKEISSENPEATKYSFYDGEVKYTKSAEITVKSKYPGVGRIAIVKYNWTR